MVESATATLAAIRTPCWKLRTPCWRSPARIRRPRTGRRLSACCNPGRSGWSSTA